jgi:AraC family transcriptional regulator
VQILTEYPGSPNIDFQDPGTMKFLNVWFGSDNIFKGSSKKLSYENNRSNFSIKTVLKGEMVYVIDGREKLVEPGTFLVINKGTKYNCYIDAEEPVVDVSVQITDKTLTEAFRLSSANDRELLDAADSYNNPVQLETISFMDKLSHHLLCQIADQERDCMQRDETKINLLARYFRLQHHQYAKQFEGLKNEHATTKKEILKRVHLAKDFLHSNYKHPINLEQVAVAACLSPGHMIRKFQEVFEITPYQYLRNLRLRKAVELLGCSNMSVQQITYAIGFESPSSFIRAFRQYYRNTPMNVRKLYQASEGLPPLPFSAECRDAWADS